MAALLAWGGVQLVLHEREAATSIGASIPAWIAQLALPAGFVLIAARLVWRADAAWRGRLLAGTGLIAALVLLLWPASIEMRSFTPWLVTLVAAAALGAPIFALLGGAAVLLFMIDGVTPAAVLIETYALNTSPTLPAIPLFTLAGFLLAEGQASSRLLRRLPGLVRLDSRRHRGGLRGAVLILHGVHGRLRASQSWRWEGCSCPPC